MDDDTSKLNHCSRMKGIFLLAILLGFGSTIVSSLPIIDSRFASVVIFRVIDATMETDGSCIPLYNLELYLPKLLLIPLGATVLCAFLGSFWQWCRTCFDGKSMLEPFVLLPGRLMVAFHLMMYTSITGEY